MKAMQLKPSVNLENLSRVADFQTWGVAASEAMGFDRDIFLNALKENRSVQNKKINNNIPLFNEIMFFMHDKPYWQGYPHELLDLLKGCVAIPAFLPKNAASLGKDIRQAISPLKDSGVEVFIPENSDGTGKLYRIINHNLTETIGNSDVNQGAQDILMAELISNIIEKDGSDDGNLRDKESGLRFEPTGGDFNV